MVNSAEKNTLWALYSLTKELDKYWRVLVPQVSVFKCVGNLFAALSLCFPIYEIGGTKPYGVQYPFKI